MKMIYPEPEALQDFNLHEYCILFVPPSVMDGSWDPDEMECIS